MKTGKIIWFIICILLLTGCDDVIVKPDSDNQNMEDFEAAWLRVNDVYPFLDFKHINWDSIHDVYLPRVEAARGDEFYLVLGDLLAELKDGHTYYQTKGGGQVYPFYPHRHFRDRHAYSPFVVRKYFNDELQLTPGESAEYGITPENIGYIFLSDFSGDDLSGHFPGIMQYLKDTRGIIIDIRQKRGGNYQTVLTLISWFLSSPLDPPKLYKLGELIEQSPIEPIGPSAYTKPVVVMVNGSTFSAGEVITEIFKQIPTVTVIGDTTGGGGVVSFGSPPAAVGEYFLPSGKEIYIGTGYIERYDGLPYEWLGVTPDIRVVQTEEDIKAGRDLQLEYAINILK